MPEVGRDDREYWLKKLMGLAIEAHRLGEQLFEEEKVFDVDGSVREAKMAVYGFKLECKVRNAQLINSAILSSRQHMLMKWRYIKGKPWKDIFRLLNTTTRYTYSIHKSALQRLLTANAEENFKEAYHTQKAKLDALNPYVEEYE